jgi:hypothetical protein
MTETLTPPTVAAGAVLRAAQIEPDRDASCPLHEAAALLTDHAGHA